MKKGKKKKTKYIIQRGRYVYRRKTYEQGEVLFRGGWFKASLYFWVMPIYKGKVHLKRDGVIIKTKTVHRTIRV